MDAIAICKCCAKGVCSTCAMPLAQGVACSQECAIFANETSEMIRGGIAARKLNTKAGGGYFQPVFLAVIGIAFLFSPILYGKPLRLSGFPFVMGALVLTFGIVLGAYHVAWKRRVRKDV